MVSCDTCFLTLALVSAFLVVSMDARSWDIAVTIDKQIDFFAQNGTEVRHSEVADARKLMGLAYDNLTRTMYMSDGEHRDTAMYSSSLNETELDPRTILQCTNSTQITAIAFDQKERTLFWTESPRRAIMEMKVPLNEDPGSPKVLHDLKNNIPYGIAIDICNRFMYWSNWEKKGVCTIERSKLDGSDRKVIIKGSMHNVYGLAVDHSAEKLYWVDDTEGDNFSIERSNLDGTNRELFYNSTHQEPIYIAVDNDAVYWTDWTHNAIWKMKKNKGTKDVPEKIKSYAESRLEYPIMSIITRDNIDVDCHAIPRGVKIQPVNAAVSKTLGESIENLTASKEEMNRTTPLEKNCLNGGRYDELTAACICEKGFNGSLCEISLCHNYCVHGNCSIDASGSPKCVCNTSHAGDRCDRDICDGYCLNNGSCSVSDTGPSCECKNYLGTRCEYATELDMLCTTYCMKTEQALDSVGVAFCKCSQANETLPERIAAEQLAVPSTIILSVLVGVIASLAIVVMALSYHVHKLKRRPRIRKRFVVSKSGVTPLTSRPQLPADSCEITIENCCNMNICETPCFEPKLRATPTKSSSTKKEEKNSLLDSMEGGDSC